MTYFVWVESLRGPSPEKWNGLLKDMNDRVLPYLSIQELTDWDENNMSLDELAIKYPAPVRRVEKEKIEVLGQ